MLRPASHPPSSGSARVPFTGKDLYALAQTLPAYAADLADLDPRRVNLAACRRFNLWLTSLRRFEVLGPRLDAIRPARTTARWQFATLTLLLWLLVYLIAYSRGMTTLATVLLNSTIFVFLAFYMLPQRHFGTTVEEIEGKVLRVVLVLEEMLAGGQIILTEAAYFKAHDWLEAARLELREQLDLAHRD